MKKKDQQEQSLLETLHLTTKLEHHLKKMYTDRKKHSSRPDPPFPSPSPLQHQINELISDNQHISHQLLKLTQQNQQLRLQVQEHAQYICFLEKNSQALKKQLLFWMHKPIHTQPNAQTRPSSQIGSLMNEVLKLRTQNRQKELHLRHLSSHSDFSGSHSNRSMESGCLAQTVAIPLRKEDLKIHSLAALKTKKKEPECTSCNYAGQSGSKGVPKSSSFTAKRKQGGKLCPCHRKYLKSNKMFM